MTADPADSSYRITTDTSNDEDSDAEVQVQQLHAAAVSQILTYTSLHDTTVMSALLFFFKRVFSLRIKDPPSEPLASG